jgi:hypothetical protein
MGCERKKAERSEARFCLCTTCYPAPPGRNFLTKNKKSLHRTNKKPEEKRQVPKGETTFNTSAKDESKLKAEASGRS